MLCRIALIVLGLTAMALATAGCPGGGAPGPGRRPLVPPRVAHSAP